MQIIDGGMFGLEEQKIISVCSAGHGGLWRGIKVPNTQNLYPNDPSKKEFIEICSVCGGHE